MTANESEVVIVLAIGCAGSAVLALAWWTAVIVVWASQPWDDRYDRPIN
jgi:hypothetical protein